jgi:hypothetical protein
MLCIAISFAQVAEEDVNIGVENQFCKPNLIGKRSHVVT